MPARTLVGTVFAALVVALARRSQSLSTTGAIAAMALGVVCSAAGSSWALLLVGFFVSATLVSHFRSGRKENLIADVVEKGGRRDALQVLANGGIFSAAALASIVHPSPIWMCIGAGAIAASSADTWSTEIGVLSGAPPRSIITGRIVAPGQSGGITWIGTVGGLAGALVIALITILVGWRVSATLAALTGGFTGCLVDSILGATIQARRWCDHCNRATERPIHTCGTTTDVAGGLPFLTNDIVNTLGSASGALVGSLWYLLGNQ